MENDTQIPFVTKEKYMSPFAGPFPQMPVIEGVRLSVANSGMRYTRNDLLLVEMPENTAVAGVFTKNSMPGAPVDWCKSILYGGKARALIVNAGISNVFTGKAGALVVKNTAQNVANILGCQKDEVFVSSTGVIGELPDEKKLIAKLPELKSKLSPTAWEDGVRAIMTTDTFPKAATKKAKIGNTEVNINGFIKGSGMIAPDMATMLGYIFTDASISSEILQSLLSEDVKYSYNCMSVDSDTSTSDTILVFATGKRQHPPVARSSDPILDDFRKKLREVNVELAKLVAKDGEGISKFVTIKVKDATSYDSARIIGLSIANSPLVKTALAAGDPNWGRIIMGIGKSGQKADRDKTSIWIGDTLIAMNGAKHPEYIESKVAEYMKGKEIEIVVSVGVGNSDATVWTCDLTHEYVSINADYRS